MGLRQHGPEPRAPAHAVRGADFKIASVARGVEEAACSIGWPLRILDGRGNAAGHRNALKAAIQLDPGGIVLGGFDAAK